MSDNLKINTIRAVKNGEGLLDYWMHPWIQDVLNESDIKCDLSQKVKKNLAYLL